MAKKISVFQAVREHIKSRRKTIEGLLVDLILDEGYISPKVPRKLTYEVGLISHWANEGEKGVKISGIKPLEQLLVSAVKEFHQINKRKDFQFDWCVRVVLPSGVVVTLPEESWVKIKNKIKDGD